MRQIQVSDHSRTKIDMLARAGGEGQVLTTPAVVETVLDMVTPKEFLEHLAGTFAGAAKTQEARGQAPAHAAARGSDDHPDDNHTDERQAGQSMAPVGSTPTAGSIKTPTADNTGGVARAARQQEGDERGGRPAQVQDHGRRPPGGVKAR